jgi:hypothetical protein
MHGRIEKTANERRLVPDGNLNWHCNHREDCKGEVDANNDVGDQVFPESV